MNKLSFNQQKVEDGSKDCAKIVVKLLFTDQQKVEDNSKDCVEVDCPQEAIHTYR